MHVATLIGLSIFEFLRILRNKGELKMMGMFGMSGIWIGMLGENYHVRIISK